MLNNNTAIKIGILDISAQNKAILEFFFNNAGKTLFKEVDPSKAAAFIIDYDSLGAKESWQSIYESTNKPGIIISIHEVDLPSTVWVAKPLTTKALTQAGHKIKEMLTEDNDSAVNNTPVVEAIEEYEKFEENISNFWDWINEKNVKEVTQIKQKAKIVDNTLALADTFDADLLTSAQQVVDVLPSNKSDHSEIDNLLESLISSTKSNQIESLLSGNNQKNNDSTDSSTIKDSNEEVTSEEPKETDDSHLKDILIGELVEDIDVEIAEGFSLKASDANPNTIKEKPVASPDLPVEPLAEEVAPDELVKSELEESIDELVESSDENITEDFNLKVLDINDEKSLESPELSVEPLTEELAQDELIEDKLVEVESALLGEIPLGELVDNTDDLSTEATPEAIPYTITETNSIEQTIEIDNSVDQEETQESISITSSMDKSDLAEDELQRLLDEIRNEAESSNLFTQVSKDSDGNDTDEVHFNSEAEMRWSLLCGSDSTRITSSKDLKKNSYNPDDHLLATFNEVLEKSLASKQVMQLKFGMTVIIIDASNDIVYCDDPIMEEAYAKLCYEPVNKDQIKIHILDASEVRMLLKNQETDADNSHTIESFIWTTALLSSRGRLASKTDLKQQFGIKHWPNLTRLESFPHVIQIAAVLKKGAASLLEITNWLEHVPQSSIFAFYNGALALDLIEQDLEKLKSFNGDIKKSTNTKNRGFFSRLLKRITR